MKGCSLSRVKSHFSVCPISRVQNKQNVCIDSHQLIVKGAVSALRGDFSVCAISKVQCFKTSKISRVQRFKTSKIFDSADQAQQFSPVTKSGKYCIGIVCFDGLPNW